MCLQEYEDWQDGNGQELGHESRMGNDWAGDLDADVTGETHDGRWLDDQRAIVWIETVS